MNAFLKKTERISSGFGLAIRFLEGSDSGSPTDLFPETGLLGILEASYYSSVDQLPSFLGAMVDEFCGNFYSPEVTSVFNVFVDLYAY